MAPLLDNITNLDRHAARQPQLGGAKKAAAATAATALASPPPLPAAALEGAAREQEAANLLVRGLVHVSLNATEEMQEAEAEEEPTLLSADSFASSTTASVCGRSQLGSPMVAFAAAKERLIRSNSEAGSLIDSTLQALSGMQQSVAAAGAARKGATAGALARLQHKRGLVVARSQGSSPMLTALQKRNAALKEHLHSTIALCCSLHTQSFEAVSSLHEDNKQLKASLQEAQLDKECLQQTIRQLTLEAVQLAEQARQALLPEEQAHASGAVLVPSTAAASATAGATEPAALSLVRDWSCATSSGSSTSSMQGATWQPGTSVHSFDASMAAAVYVQGSSDAGDKRRRLTPGMLAHCLRPAIAEAVTEAATMGGSSCRSPTPGNLTKQKHRQLSGGSMGGAAVAPDAATLAGSPGAQPAQLHSRFVAAGLASAAPRQHGSCRALDPPTEAQGEQQFRTFELFDSMWHGSSGQLQPRLLAGALMLANNGSGGRWRCHDPGCSIM